jgi:CheY-like chemotaxis protein
MPLLDGIAACQAIRADEERHGRGRLPIVALTAHASAEWAEACLAAGFDRYLTKPLQVDALPMVMSLVAEAGRQTTDTAGPEAVESHPLSRLDPRIAAHVVGTFRLHAPASLTGLQTAVATGDPAATAQWAHRLAGALAYVEGGEVHDLAVRLQQDPGAPDAAQVLATLTDQMDRLYAELERDWPATAK